MPEKTYPISVAEEARARILEIQQIAAELNGLKATQRSVVELAIKRLYTEMKGLKHQAEGLATHQEDKPS